jgi:hypothetical protein
VTAVEFEPEGFRKERPRFAGLPDEVLLRVFREAELILGNGDGSPIPYEPPARVDRKTFLHLLVCHLAELELRSGDAGATGNVASVTQGSVSVSFSQLTGSASESYWNQTACGQTFLALMRRYGLGGRYYGAGRAYPFV